MWLGARGSSARRSPGVSACASISKVGKCNGRFSLGIPHTTKAFSLIAYFGGMQKNGILKMNILDSTGQPISDPFSWKLCCPTGYAWTLPFEGPFTPMTLKLSFVYKNKPVGTPFTVRIT